MKHLYKRHSELDEMQQQKLLLIDRIRQCIQSLHLFCATLQPPGRAVDRIFHISAIRYTRRTFIKSHSNRRAKIRLNLHTLFRSHKNFGTIHV